MKHGSQSLSLRERQRSAREQFFQGNIPLQFGLDPAVIRGWQRSLAFGIEPDREVVFQAVHLNRLRAALDANRPLLAAADAELDQLARTLVPGGASVLLTDASLVVVGVRGHREAMSPELRISSREGIDLSERQVGSNALSIAAIENAPSVVLHNAHYCTVNSVFACAAAPIRAPGGSLLGIIDVTTCHRALPAEAPFLVTAAAKAIENALFESQPDQIVVRLHPRSDLIGTPLEAVIAVNTSGEVVGANEAALGMLGMRWPLRAIAFDRLFRDPFSQVLSQAGRLERFAVALVTAAGLPVHAQVSMPARPRAAQTRPPARSSAIGDARDARDARVGPSAQPSDGAGTTPDGLGRLAGGDPALLSQWRLAAGALARGVPVVLVGESGSGRKTLAQALHGALEAAGPLQVMHCVDLREAEFEAAMAAASGGTLVLDEASALPEPLQARLLRRLQQHESLPGGAGFPRLLTVTEHDLRHSCEAGRFRYDLCHRLKGLSVGVPPLHRRADLRARILARLAQERSRAGLSVEPGALPIAPEAMDALLSYRWPGNFRELGWMLSAAIAVAGARPVGLDDLPGEVTATNAAAGDPIPCARGGGRSGDGSRAGERVAEAEDAGPAEPLRALQDRAIRLALDHHRGNLSSAARELGISRGTLYRRLKALGIGTEAAAERSP